MAITKNEIQTILSAQDRSARAFESFGRRLGNVERAGSKLASGLGTIAKGGFLAIAINEVGQLGGALGAGTAGAVIALAAPGTRFDAAFGTIAALSAGVVVAAIGLPPRRTPVRSTR